MKRVKRIRTINKLVSQGDYLFNYSSAFEKSSSPEVRKKDIVVEEEEKPKTILNSKKIATKGLKLGAKKQEIMDIGNSLQETKEEVKEEFVNPLEEPIRIEIEEKIKCELTKDGDLKKFDVKGEAYMTVTNSQKKKCAVQLKMDPKQKLLGLVIHPNILNKKTLIIFKFEIIQLKYETWSPRIACYFFPDFIHFTKLFFKLNLLQIFSLILTTGDIFTINSAIFSLIILIYK